MIDRGTPGYFKKIIPHLPKGKDIVFRPHPLKRNNFIKGIKTEFKQKINWDNIYAAITDMSAFGNEVIKNRRPLYCEKKASYAKISNLINEDKKLKKRYIPNKNEIENYFKRLARTQFKIDEMDKMWEYFKEELKENGY